ncbi:hypothetical protein EV121DRAFT_292313 [Schizophyllum commune]
MRRGPRGNPSLTAATCTYDHVREVEGLRDQQRGALPGFRQQGFLNPFRDRKICRSTSNGPGSAPKVLVDVRDCRGRGGGGAKRSLYRRILLPSQRHYAPTLLSLVLIMLSAPPANRSAFLSERRLDAMQYPFASFGTDGGSRLYLLPSLVPSYAEQSRSSTTISGDLYKTNSTLKQCIDVPRARVNLTDIAIPPPFHSLRPFPPP